MQNSDKLRLPFNPLKAILIAGVSAIAIYATSSSVFVVDPSDRAGVRSFGVVTTDKPI